MSCSAPDCKKKPVIITRADPQFEKPLHLCEDHSRELMCSYPKCFMPGIRYKYDIIKCEHKHIQHVVLCDDHADLFKAVISALDDLKHAREAEDNFISLYVSRLNIQG